MAKGNRTITILSNSSAANGIVQSPTEVNVNLINSSPASSNMSVYSDGIRARGLASIATAANVSKNIGRTAIGLQFSEFDNAVGQKKFNHALSAVGYATAIAINPVFGTINLGVGIATNALTTQSAARKETRNAKYLSDRLGIATNLGGR